MEKLTEQEKVRRQKMQDLQDMGIDPFGKRYDAQQLLEKSLKRMKTAQKKNFRKKKYT